MTLSYRHPRVSTDRKDGARSRSPENDIGVSYRRRSLPAAASASTSRQWPSAGPTQIVSNISDARSGLDVTPIPPTTTGTPSRRYSPPRTRARSRTSILADIPTRSNPADGMSGAEFSFTTTTSCPQSSTMRAIVRSPRCGAILAFNEVSIGLVAASGCISFTRMSAQRALRPRQMRRAVSHPQSGGRRTSSRDAFRRRPWRMPHAGSANQGNMRAPRRRSRGAA